MLANSSKTKQTAIFFHIVKTAGTTLHQIIDRHYQPDETYWIGTKGHPLEHFTSLSEADRAKIRLLRGHMVFGLHTFLPGPSIYFTLLRDPVERTLSYYYFIRRTPEHYCHDLITSNDMSLEEFLENKADDLIINGQTRVLAGKKWHKECTEGAVEAAKRNLREHFTIVGLVERFDETLHLLKRALNWQNLYYIRQNVGTNRPGMDGLPPATLDAVIKANQFDIELYQYATELFEEKIRQQGPLFALQVKLFQLVNQNRTRFSRLLPGRTASTTTS